MAESVAVASEFSAGTILDDKYRIEKVLGTGGMGAVLLAHHLDLDERVAIKVLLPQALANPELVERFIREARASIKIKSEHVARVMDVCRLPSGTPYMVMEFLAGEDLARRLARSGALAVSEAVDLILQACEALAEAHVLGIVHRDLKPANLFLVEGVDGREIVKVLDFGISKIPVHGGASASMTQTETRMGSPLYMSPEQMKSSKDVDAGTDIWALGVTLHQLITATLPYAAESLPELFHLVMTTPAPGIRKSRPDLPTELEQVVLRCLSKDRGRRYRSVLELADALWPFGTSRASQSRDHVARVVARLTREYPIATNASPEATRANGSQPHVVQHTLDSPPQILQRTVESQPVVERTLEVHENVTVSSLAPWGKSQSSRPNALARQMIFGLVALGAAGASAFAYFRVRHSPNDTQPIAPASQVQTTESILVSESRSAPLTSPTARASAPSTTTPPPVAASVASTSGARPTPSSAAPARAPVNVRRPAPVPASAASFVPTDFGDRR